MPYIRRQWIFIMPLIFPLILRFSVVDVDVFSFDGIIGWSLSAPIPYTYYQQQQQQKWYPIRRDIIFNILFRFLIARYSSEKRFDGYADISRYGFVVEKIKDSNEMKAVVS